MKNTNKNSNSEKKYIRFEHSLINKIEETKDPLITFSAWVKQACRDKIEKEKKARVRTVKQEKEGTSTHIEETSRNSDNEKRAKKTFDQLINGIQALTGEEKIKVNSSRYPKNELFKALNEQVSKDSIRKYWNEAHQYLLKG